MISYNIDASGQKLRVNFDEDISSATDLTMSMQPERGAVITVTPTLGTADVEVGDETFLANQYVEYAVIADQFTYIGRYLLKAAVTLSGVVIVPNAELFRVLS